MLFTHRGLSGPAILQISSYWREGQEIAIDLLPDLDASSFLKERKRMRPRAELRTVLDGLVRHLREPVTHPSSIPDRAGAKLPRF